MALNKLLICRAVQHLVKVVPPVVALVTTSVHASEIRAAQVTKYQDWETRILAAEDSIYFRAITLSDRDGLIATLSIDRVAPSCKPTAIVIRLLASTPRKNDIDKSVFGQIRVDENAIRNILLRFTTQKGNQHASLTMLNWDREASLTQELAAGKTLRVKLTEDGEDHYLNFSLLGFRESFVESRELCEIGRNLPSQERDDADYFKRGV